KGGAVTSHIRIANDPADIMATRIPTGQTRLLLGCDAIVSTAADVLDRVAAGQTRAVINDAPAPTAQVIHDASWRYPTARTHERLQTALGGQCEFMDASALALSLLGDTIYANPLMLGYAWQKGWIPLTEDSLRRAIELNAVMVEKNLAAFDWGRRAAHDGAAALLAQRSGDPAGADGAVASSKPTTNILPLPETLDQCIARNEAWLTAYQSAAYARRYRAAVDAVRAREESLLNASATAGRPGRVGAAEDLPLTLAVAHNLAKLMAYKDEYEVARLQADPSFRADPRDPCEGEPGRDYQIRFHMAPPPLARRDEVHRPKKTEFGQWMLNAMKLLARFRRLRGPALDPFGRSEERRRERAWIRDYEIMLDEFVRSLDLARLPTAIELARLPETIRGYGYIKEAAMDAAEARRAVLMEQYRNGPAQEIKRAVA